MSIKILFTSIIKKRFLNSLNVYSNRKTKSILYLSNKTLSKKTTTALKYILDELYKQYAFLHDQIYLDFYFNNSKELNSSYDIFFLKELNVFYQFNLNEEIIS